MINQSFVFGLGLPLLFLCDLSNGLATRRSIVTSVIRTLAAGSSVCLISGGPSCAESSGVSTTVQQILKDPETYSALLYQPPKCPDDEKQKLPMIIFLHGAGKNDRDISNLADIQGEYAGLLPSLIETKTAPAVLMDNFVVLSPYAYGERSFYNEPRSKLLAFIAFALTRLPQVDPSRVFLFGFSDGATLSVELLTTRRFAGGIVCSYGFIGTLPDLALQRLSELPLWVFHSADDQIFRVTNSDNLVQSLRKHSSNCTNPLLMKYTRFDRDPESFAGPARGHTTGITASRDPAVYEWLLSLPPLR